LTNDTVHTVPGGGSPGGPGSPDGGGTGGGPGGGGSSGSGAPGGGQEYILLAPPGVARVVEEPKGPRMSGEIHPKAAKLLRQYQEQERRRAMGIDDTTDGGSDDGGGRGRTRTRPGTATGGGRGQERTRTRPTSGGRGQEGQPGGQPAGGEPQGRENQTRTRTNGQAREQILIEPPRIVEPEPTPTTQERERAKGQSGEAKSREAESGKAKPDKQARSQGGDPDQQARPEEQGQGREQERPDGRGRPESDGQPREDGRPEADGKSRSEGRTEEEAKAEEKAEGRGRRRRRTSARQRARAEARAEQAAQDAQDRQAKAAPKPKPDPTESRTLYEILGITKRPKDVTKADVREAYRERARILHPDNPGTGDADEYKKLTDARAILSNAKDKKVYDTQQAIKHVFDTLGLRRRGTTTMEPGTAYDVGKAIGELPGLSPEAQTAWALANILEVIRLLNGYKQIPVDGGLFGMNEEAQKTHQILLTPVAANGREGVVLRVDHLDPESGARTGETEYLMITRGEGNQVNVQGSKGVADVLGDPKLQETGKDGGPATAEERAEAALRALADALALDYEQVKTADPVDVYEQAKETAQSSGGGDDDPDKDKDKDDNDGNKDDKDKKDDEGKKWDEWGKWGENDNVPDKPLWKMTEAERKAYFDKIVEERVQALKREMQAKRKDGDLRVRANETIKEAEARRKRDDAKKAEERRLRVEAQVMREMVHELELEKHAHLQDPQGRSVKEQRQLKQTLTQMKREAVRYQDAVIQDWRHGKQMEPSTAQAYKEFRWGAKAKGKKGNAYKRGYTEEQMVKMRNMKHPNRPGPETYDGNRGPGRGPERKPNGKRKLVSKAEYQQRRREYRHSRREHDHNKTTYLNSLAEQKALKAKLSKAKGKERGVIKAQLRAIRHQIGASRRGMNEAWFDMQKNSYHGMALRAAVRGGLNMLNK
jgi:hypothetical protein